MGVGDFDRALLAPCAGPDRSQDDATSRRVTRPAVQAMVCARRLFLFTDSTFSASASSSTLCEAIGHIGRPVLAPYSGPDSF